MSGSSGAFICGCAGLSLGSDEVAFFRETRPWGLILFRRNVESPDQLRRLTSSFRAAVENTAAPIFVDQEGGRVQRLGPPDFKHWRRYPPAERIGAIFADKPIEGLRAARLMARLMAHDLHAVGITADCLPVLDVPQDGAHDVIGDRAYARDAAAVALLGRAVVAGMLDGGVLPVIKHIPGHGRARADSHLALPVVESPLAELEASDFFPFAALADAPMAMTAHVVYSAIDRELPATLSPVVIDLIRRSIGFEGLLMSDDVSMKALSGPLEGLAKAARLAGCDLALHCNGTLAEMELVAKGAGSLDGAAAQRAARALAIQRSPDYFDAEQAVRKLSSLFDEIA